MKDAQLMIQKPGLLVKAVKMIEPVAADGRRRKRRSLRVLAEQADDGRYQRTVSYASPHHTIDGRYAGAEAGMVIGDPACGTAGFLVENVQYLLKNNTFAHAGHPETEGEKLFIPVIS